MLEQNKINDREKYDQSYRYSLINKSMKWQWTGRTVIRKVRQKDKECSEFKRRRTRTPAIRLFNWREVS